MKKKQLLSYVLVCFFTGCTVFNPTHYASNDKHRYLKSKNGTRLEIPSSLSSANISDFYQLPDQNQPANVSIVPPHA